MPIARWNHAAVVVGGRIYVVGGFDASNRPLNTVEVYDPATRGWSACANMPTPRGLLAAVDVGGKLFAIGGTWTGPDTLAAVEMYDPETDTWTRKADLATPRNALSASVVDGKVYAIGGWGAAPPPGGWATLTDRSAAEDYVHTAVKDFSTVEVYDPLTDTWTSAVDMPTPRSHMSTSVIDGVIYAVGGVAPSAKRNASRVISTRPLSLVEAYNPATHSWTVSLPPMPTARWSYGSSVIDGRICVSGGITSARDDAAADEAMGSLVMLAAVEIYHPASEAWRASEDLATARGGLTTSFVEGKNYAIGGRASSTGPGGVMEDVEEYTLRS